MNFATPAGADYEYLPPHSTLVRWLAADGEYVLVDQPICEIETDETSVDFPAWANGYLRHNAFPGDIVKIEEPFAMIEVR